MPAFAPPTHHEIAGALIDWHDAAAQDDAIGSPATFARRQDCYAELRRIARELAADRDQRHFRKVEELRKRGALMAAVDLKAELAKHEGEQP